MEKIDEKKKEETIAPEETQATVEDTKKTTEEKKDDTPEKKADTPAQAPSDKDASRHPVQREGGSSGSRNKGHKRNNKRPSRKGRGERVKPEFDQKIVSIRRVVRVVSGGRRFSFSVAMVIGNRRGRVGVGVGKAGDTALAIDKAMRSAKRNMIDVKLTDKMSIPHELDARFCSSNVLIMPAPGKGLVAGGAVRNVLDLAGVKNVSAKILSRSKNHLNNAQAALLALGQLVK